MKTYKPEVKSGVISRVDKSPFGYFGWPTVIYANGRLYAVCSGFRIEHLCPFGKTALFESFDLGASWSRPTVVNDTLLDDRDAGIVDLGDGGLAVSWFTHPIENYENQYLDNLRRQVSPGELKLIMGEIEFVKTFPPEERTGGSYLRYSADRGSTWGEIVRVPVSAPHGPSVMPDGTLVYVGNGMYSPLVDGTRMECWASSDGFKWEKRGDIPYPDGVRAENFWEAHTLPLGGDKLLTAIRYERRREDDPFPPFTVFTCTSEDGGRTFTTPVCLGVDGSPPHLLRHSSGRIILTFGRRNAPFGERAVVSDDNGATWSEEYIIRDDAPDGDLGYPTTAELPDGSLITVYYQKLTADEKPCLQYSKWSLR